eukprot:3642925-Alexandrium_andersonii.AAC.1
MLLSMRASGLQPARDMCRSSPGVHPSSPPARLPLCRKADRRSSGAMSPSWSCSPWTIQGEYFWAKEAAVR